MTPASIINSSGQPEFGVFDDTVHVMNHGDFAARSDLGRRLLPPERTLRYKQFQYFGIIAEDLIAGCAVANLGLIAVAFTYLYLPQQGEMVVERGLKIPLRLGSSFSQSPVEGQTRIRVPGADITLGYQSEPRRKTLRVDLGAARIHAALDETAAGFTPMSLCTRAGMSGWVYANKVAAVPVTGTVGFGGETIDLASIGAFGHHDFSAGYMRRETFWNWACLSGAINGRPVGLNISCGVNETSYSENCVWLDGRCIPVGQATFDYDPVDPMARPWALGTTDGAVDLRFTPEGLHQERTNLLLLASNFRQIFGRFDGTLTADGTVLPVEGMYGFVEEQYAKW